MVRLPYNKLFRNVKTLRLATAFQKDGRGQFHFQEPTLGFPEIGLHVAAPDPDPDPESLGNPKKE